MKDDNRPAFEAESTRLALIKRSIRAACPRQDIDFAAARKQELQHIRVAEPSALFLVREKQRDAISRL